MSLWEAAQRPRFDRNLDPVAIAVALRLPSSGAEIRAAVAEGCRINGLRETNVTFGGPGSAELTSRVEGLTRVPAPDSVLRRLLELVSAL